MFSNFIDFDSTECLLYIGQFSQITGIPRHYDSVDIEQIFAKQIYFTPKNNIKTIFKIFPNEKK